MARERWFYAFDNQRRGPVPLGPLVDSLLSQPDPRACLVWRKGLSAWTRAGEVAEVSQRLATPAGRWRLRYNRFRPLLGVQHQDR